MSIGKMPGAGYIFSLNVNVCVLPSLSLAFELFLRMKF